MILGIDAGGAETKVCGPYGTLRFSSAIGEFRERNLQQRFGDDDMVFEYDGRRGFAGTLAQYESEWGSTRKGDTKAHEDAKVRILLAIHRYATERTYQIVVGQPIGTHTPDQKDAIKRMLVGRHELTVNGVTKSFIIERVEVAAEGASASVADPRKGLMRLIDIGSGTINFATLHDMRYIDRDSWTLRKGMETLRSIDHAEMARGIANEALMRWKETDFVRLVGGGAEALHAQLVEYLPNCEILRPKVWQADTVRVVEPVFANAVGFYEIARKVYG